MRLGMSLIVRDEADVIAANLRFHALMGVDAFAVLDNGSRDATWDIVKRLCSDYDIALLRDTGSFEKERQSMMLATHLRKHQRVDWLISNDADEFWLPKRGNLRSLMSQETPVKTVRRFNYVVQRKEVQASEYVFYDSCLLARRPYGFQPPAPHLTDPLLSPMMLRRIPNKIVCAIEGLEFVYKGAHRVAHRYRDREATSEAEIFHYQIRSYETFERKVLNHAESLAGGNEDTSWHLRRWYRAYLAGTLRDEYDSLLLDEKQATDLLAAGVLERTYELANILQKVT